MKTKFFQLFISFSLWSSFLAFAQKSDISVTVYNQDLALIRDVRTVNVSKGEQLLRFKNVTARIDPTSVHLRSLTNPDGFKVLEQNFEYDLVDSKKILRKYIDHEIEIFTSTEDTLKGTLLSSSDELILALPAGNIQLIQPREIRSVNFPKLPEGLITRPTLVWLIKAERKQQQKIETEYLSRGLSWHAEYVGILNSGETELDLTIWVSVENNAGITLEDAKLKLVAGDINLVRKRLRPQYELAKSVALAEDQMVAEKEFFEYHLYTVNRRTTLNNNQVKQITLFSASGVAVHKKYIFDGRRWPNRVRVYTRLKNDEKNHLGVPFPAGKFRVYKKDEDGSMIFLGEDQINHTPKDEWIEIFLGNAFDIKAERKQVASRRIGNNRLQESYEIVLRNHKKEMVSVAVIEQLLYRSPVSNWKITESSLPFRKKDARTVEFIVNMAANDELKLSYTVDYSW